jgi:hypothetical protein
MRLIRLVLAPIFMSGLCVFCANGQDSKTAPSVKVTVKGKAEAEIAVQNPAITATTSALDLAKAALAAQGGEKFRQVKTVFMTGTADLSSDRMPRVLPASFAMTYKGDKTRMDIKSPMMSVTSINDGPRSYSSINGFNLPSLNKFGTRVLAKYDQPGYVVSDLPNKKKYRAFRITDPDGDGTDFYLDPVTGRVMSYEFTYNGARSVVEHDKFRVVDGILVPEKFAQRFEVANAGTFFAEFKIKEIQVNLEVEDDVFSIPEQ